MAGFIVHDMMADMAKKSKKAPVTNEKIFGLLLDMDERITGMDERITGMDGRVTGMDERMVTKDDLVEVLKNYPTKADLAETVKDLPRKNDLDKVRADISEEVRPLVKAFDKDAVTLIDYGKRIVALERKADAVAK